MEIVFVNGFSQDQLEKVSAYVKENLLELSLKPKGYLAIACNCRFNKVTKYKLEITSLM